jgi:protein-disulfide isomerase
MFVHFPLPMHRFARGAAVASECALRAGKFDDIQRTFFEKQDSLGLKSWGSFARDIGIGDTVSFNACVRTESFARIDSGVAIGGRLAVTGTPTVFVNGYRFAGLTGDGFRRMVDRIVAGKPPVDALSPK